MFDPNQPLPDFQTQQEQLAQQRMYANALRKHAMDQRQPQGQMVGEGLGAQYVAPHFLEQLAPAFAKAMGSYESSRVDAADKEFGARTNEARQDWQSKLPQAIAAQTAQDPPQDIGGNMVQGPQYETAPAQPITTERILKHTLAGMNIPGNEKAADLYNRGALADLTREDAQAARKEDRIAQETARRENLAANLQARKEELEMKLADTSLGREERVKYEKMHDDTLRYLGGLMLEGRKYSADQSREAAEARAEAKKTDKPLAHLVHKDLSERDATATAMQDLKSTFKPEFAGPAGYLKDKAGTYIPGATTETAEWWKNYRKNVQLIERHASFGGTLTPNEQASWRSADIEVGMNPELVQKNLATRSRLAEKVYEKARQQYIGGGHNIEGAFPARGSYVPDKSATSGPVTPAGDLSPAEQARLEFLRAQKANQ